MRLISILLLVASLTFANSEKIEISFKDLKIDEFVKMVSKISNKNILLNASIPGKVNFISVKPINKNQIYDLLISVLKNKGYTIVDSGSGYLKVIRSSNASREAPPFRGLTKLNQVQTDIIGIKNLTATKMVAQINFLMSKFGKIAISKETNSLIITDFPKNLISIKRLLKKLDSQKNMQIEFIELQNSKVKMVLPKVKNIANSLYDQKVPSQKVNIFSDEATNTLIIISQKEIIKKLKSYVKKLDKKDEVSQRYLHIIHLNNSDAVVLAKTLDSIISKKPLEKKLKKVKTPTTLSKKPTFTADKETNILMVYASNEEIKEINKLIEALDAPREQVFVSAKIVEINNEKASKIGAKYGIAGGVSNSSGLFTLSGELGSPPVAIDLNGLGLSVPDVKQAIALGATISLLETNEAANTLSEPSLLCVNNVESSIYVGETQSIITQGNTATDVTTVEKNNYTREDIGLTLKVKPRISSDRRVFLDVRVTIEGVKETLKIGLPITTKRDISTTAIVKNGESIIIGGLTQEITKNNDSQVPILGDIPIFGKLFQYNDDNKNKKSLVIILTPYIISKNSTLSSLKQTLVKLNELENEFVKQLEREKNAN